MGGSGILLYIILMIIIPLESKSGAKAAEKTGAEAFADEGWLEEKRNIVAFVVILVGLVALFNEIFPFWFRWNFFWPVVLILVGVYLLFGYGKNK